MPRCESLASSVTSIIDTTRCGSCTRSLNESDRSFNQNVLFSFSAWVFTPLLITTKIFSDGILYCLITEVYNLVRALSVAWKVGCVKEIKSVLTAVSFKILKEPSFFEFLPISSILSFTPFEPTSKPA